MIPDLITALILTLICEILIVLLLFKQPNTFLLLVFAINIISNPAMNLLLDRIPNQLYTPALLILEIIVIMIECIMYYLFLRSWKKAFMISAVANGFSLIVGLILMPFIY